MKLSAGLGLLPAWNRSRSGVAVGLESRDVPALRSFWNCRSRALEMVSPVATIELPEVVPLLRESQRVQDIGEDEQNPEPDQQHDGDVRHRHELGHINGARVRPALGAGDPGPDPLVT